MKLVSTLLILLVLSSLTACSKKANFDGRGKGENPTGTGADVDTNTPVNNDPVTTESYKETVKMRADVSYSSKNKVGNTDGTLSIRNEGFKIPQTIKVTQGWAGRNTTATITIKVIGAANVVCTYQSQADQTHKPVVDSAETQAKYEKGLAYTFSNCTENPDVSSDPIDPTVVVDSFDSLTLNVVSADDLETKTAVEADVKLYQ